MKLDYSVVLMKANVIRNLFTYTSLLGIVFGPMSLWASILLFFFGYLYLSFRNKHFIILFPFYLYPFMFLIRMREPESLSLTILPDLFAIISIIYSFVQHPLKFEYLKYFVLLFLYSIFIGLFAIFHVGEIVFVPVILRQYIIPIFFLLSFLNVAGRDNYLVHDALKISFNSFALVAILSVLNIFNIITIEPSMEALYPYLNFNIEDSSASIGRTFEGASLLPRLNLFTGGALGSSASLFIALGLLPFISKKVGMTLIHKLFSLPLFLAGFLTLSNSVVIPMLIFIFLVFSTKINPFLIGFSIIISSSLVLNASVFLSESLFDYFYNTAVAHFIEFLGRMDFFSFLIGVGPRIASAGFEFVPENFVIDVGVLRVFVEFGVLSFLIFFAFLVSVFKSGVAVSLRFDVDGGKSYFFLFMVYVSMVHANMTSLPPFFPLFAAVVTGILVTNSYCKKNNFKILSNAGLS